MSNQLPVVFNFVSTTLRVVMRDGNPWFVAADVCAALGVQNVTQAVERLDDDERSMFNIAPSGDTNIINESGLYSLILGSRKPEAKKFKKWVTSEVLPAIRKTGSYHAVPPAPTPDAAHEVMSSKDMGNLTRLVWMICNGLWAESAWTQAVWHRLRQVTGTASPARFQVRHLPILASEVRRISSMTTAFKNARHEAEQMLIKRVLRGGEAEGPVLEEAKRLMNEAAASDEAELGKLMERWHEHEIAALTDRKQDTFHGGYAANFAEPKKLN